MLQELEKWEIQKHLERVSVYAHVCVYVCLYVGVYVYWEDQYVLWPVNFYAHKTRELESRFFSAFNPSASGLY